MIMALNSGSWETKGKQAMRTYELAMETSTTHWGEFCPWQGRFGGQETTHFALLRGKSISAVAFVEHA